MSFPMLINEAWRAAVYYLKFCSLFAWALTTVLIIPLMYRKPGHYNNRLVLSCYSEVISSILRVTWSVKGKENIIPDGGSVVVLNHQSLLDTLGTKSLFELNVFTNFVVKKEVLYIFPLSVIFWLTGSIFIDRSNKERALKTMSKLSQGIIKDKKRLLIFPEGTRNHTEGFLPFKKGAFHTAISAQAPIQPVVIGKYKFLNHEKHRFDAGEAVISILPPIPTIGLKKEDVGYLVQKTTDIMLKEYYSLNKAH